MDPTRQEPRDGVYDNVMSTPARNFKDVSATSRTMPDATKSTFLQQLRDKSGAVRAHEHAARPVEETLLAIDRGLAQAFRWLDEAVGHLAVIQPPVAHKFQLGNILTLDQPQFERGFVSFRRRALAGLELIEYVEMFYRLTGPKPFILKVNPGSSASIDERLRAATMEFHYQTEQDENKITRYGLFHVQPSVTASVRFAPDYARRIVDVTLRNVDRLEPVQLEFQPERIDEAALEDLMKLILGEPSGFFRRAPLALIRSRREEPLPVKVV
jgi:hypothetical protein